MFIPCTDASVRGIGRFALYDEALTTTACGAKLEIAFFGDGIVLHFDMSWTQHPTPHVWLSLDGGSRFEVSLDHYVRVECTHGKHLLTVVLKGAVEMQQRWHHPLIAKMALHGYEAEAAGELPANHRPTIELIGDSITEGVLVDAEYAPDRTMDVLNRPYQDDATATYAYLTAMELGLEPLCGGYGAVGTTHAGNGGVPAAADMYPYCFEGARVTYEHPDYVLINHGTNDGWGDCVQAYPAAYTRLLDAVYAAHPHTKVIALTPFYGCLHDELIALVEEYNRTHDRDILLVDTTGWLPPEPIHPLRDGHRIAAQKLTAILRDKLEL